ncbi:MAG: zinc-ribbon domain-containing protein [Deltaproteobacteria bacterium]
MQIVCSKCDKAYRVDSGKIPPGITSTKCKACGNSISLRQNAPQTSPARPAQAPPAGALPGAGMMQITCQYCSQKYRINPKSIPQGVASTRCKSCGHAISLKLEAADTAKPEVAKKARQTTGTKKITCLYCGKKYSINAAKIPPGVTTTRCKACGRNLSLTPAAGLDFAFKEEISKKVKPLKTAEAPKDQQAAQVPIIQNFESPKSPMWRRPWALAAAAVLVVIFIGFYYSGSKFSEFAREKIRADNIFKKEQQTPVNRGTQIKRGENAPITSPRTEPFLAAKVNVPLLLEAIDQNLSEDKKSIKYKMTTGIIRSFGFNQVQLYLYPDPQHSFLPVILAEGQKGKSLQKKLQSQGNYFQFLEPLSDGTFRIKKEVIPGDKQNSFPIERYRIQFVEHTAIFAPQNLFGLFKGGQNPVRKTRVEQMIASIAQPRDLALLAVKIPENFSNDWQKRIQENPALQQNPQAAMMVAMGGGVLAQLSEPLKNVESLAIGFRLDKTSGRVLHYAQQFRKGVDGGRIYQQLQSGKPDDLDVDGMVLKLIELFNDPRYQHKISHENNLLMLDFNWEKQHDKAFFATLSEATLGQLFAQGMELTPSEGRIVPRYTHPPRLSGAVDIDNLKKTIPVAVQKSLFPGNYWDFGDQPHMTLAVDAIDVPNAPLAEMTYEVLDVVSTDGASIMRIEENQFQHIINPGSESPGNIDVSVKAGTPAEALGTAKIRFNLSLPVSLKRIKFEPGDEAGTTKESAGVRVRLSRLEKDVAKVTFRGGVSAKLFALDKTGRSLASKESMSTSSSTAARFQGEIHTLIVAVVEEMFDYPFEIEVDLNGGKELVLSHKPENPKRLRYDHHPMVTYVNYSADDLIGLKVNWREAGGMLWTDSLHVALPKGPFNGDIRWEVHFFGEHEPVYLSGNSFYGPADISYGLSNGDLKKARAAFGKIKMNLTSEVHRLSYVKQSDGETVVQKLPSGKPIRVSFNKNEITIDPAKAEIIQSMAFDARGRRLRKDSYTGIQGNQKKIYFWGLPTTFAIDVAIQKIKKTIQFDLKKRPVDKASYTQFKKDIENQREIVTTLRQIARAQREGRIQYGDDIAGMFYLYDRKKQKPMKLIDQKIAHSDPAGQERFGYDLKPYKGYYFTVLSGVESAGGKNDYMRMPKKQLFAWKNGSIKTTPFVQPPDLVAIPSDENQPTFFIQFDQVFMKQLNGTKLTYLPENCYGNGWIEAKFVGS